MPSAKIDERVVSMKFDNKQFEAGIAQSMRSLKQFDESLKLKETGQSFKKISQAADAVDLSNLEKSASSIEVKFSTMSAVAIHQINRIVDAATDAGIRMAKSLSLDQITAGFSKYTDKTNAVQTIMNATGKSVDEVTLALQKLQWFSDETSYSFVDMTSNVGKFTSAGVELNTAISAMQGIANAAADAGANASQASRVMYNFAQALGKGYVQLIDWKSIENANMSTVTFKNTMIEAGLALGTLIEKNGEYQTAAKGSAVSATNFNDSLADGWLSTEVLMKALGQYSAYSDKIYEVSDAFDTCADAMAATSEEGMELGARAFKAAQQAKTFTDAVSATKDAVSSGWMETFEIIFGDFNESVELWTGFCNSLWDIFASGAEGRNELLRGGLMSGFKQFIQDTQIDAEILKSTLKDVGRAANENFDQMVEDAGGFEKSLKTGWLTADTLKTSISNIADEIMNLNDEELKAKGYTQDTVTAFLTLKKQVDEGTISLEEFAEMMTRQSGRENIIEGISNAFHVCQQVVTAVKDALRELFPQPTVDQIYSATEKFKEFTANLKLSDEAAQSLTEAAKILLTPIKMVVSIVKNGIRIIGAATAWVWKAADAFLAWGEGAGPIPDKLRQIFGDERYNKIAESMATIVEKISNAYASVSTKVKEAYNAFKSSEKAIKFVEKFNGVLDKIKNSALDGIVKAFESLAKVDISKFADGAANGLTWVLDKLTAFGSSITSAIESVYNFFKALFTGSKDTADGVEEESSKFKLALETLPKPIQDVINFIKTLTGHIVTFVQELTPAKVMVLAFSAAFVGMSFELMGAFAAVQDILVNTAKLIATTNSFMGSAKNLMSALTMALKPDPFMRFAVAVGVTTASLLLLSLVPWQTLAANAAIFVGTVGAMTGIMTGFAALTKKLKLDKTLNTMSASLLKIAAACGILAISLRLVSGASSEFGAGHVWSSVAAILVLLAGFEGLAAAMAHINTKDISKATWAIVALGASIALMSSGLNVLSKVDTAGLYSNIMGLIAVMGALTLLTLAISKVTNPKFGMVIGLAAGIWVTCKVLQSLAKTDHEALIAGIYNLFPIFLAMVELAVVARIAGDASLKAGVSVLAMAVAALLIQDVIKTFADIDTKNIWKATTAVGALFLFFGAVVALSKLAGEHAAGAGVLILAMAGAIMVLSVAIDYIGNLDANVIKKGVAAITLLMTFMSVAIAASHYAGASAAAINAITISIVALSVCLAVLTLLPDTNNLVKVAVGLSAVMLALSAVMAATKRVDVKNALVSILEIVFVMFTLGLILDIIKSIKDPDGAQKVLVGVAAVMAGIAAALAVMSHAKNTTATAEHQLTRLIPTIGLMATAVAALGIVQALGINASIETAGALSLLFVALGTSVAAFAKLSQVSKGNKELDIGNALAYIIGIGVTAAISLALVSNVEGAVEKAGALSILYVALAASTVALTRLGNVTQPVDWSAVGGSIAMMLAVAGAATLALVLVDMGTGADGLIEKATALSIVILALGTVATVLSLVSKFANAAGISAAVLGILEIAGAIIVIAGVIALIGGVLDAVATDTAKEHIINGIGFIGDIFGAISEGIGKIVSGVIVGLADGLPKIGEDFKSFGENFKTFSEDINSVDSEKAKTAISTVTTLFSTLAQVKLQGGIDLKSFGTKLKEFAPSLVDFAKQIDVLDDTTVSKVDIACQAVAKLAEAVPEQKGAFMSWLLGDKDMTAFGMQLVAFGAGFKAFYVLIDSIEGGIKQEVVDSCANAAAIMSALAEGLPSTGGWLQRITGEKDMSGFGADLVSFGNSFVEFYNMIKDITVDEAKVTTVANAASMMSELANGLPTNGGFLQKLVGENLTMSEFGDDLVNFGDYFAQFYDKIKGLDVDEGKVDSVANAGSALAKLADAVAEHKIGGIISAITGEGMTMGQFGTDIVTFADGMAKFYNTIAMASLAGDVTGTLRLMIDNINYLTENMPDFTGWFNSTDDNYQAIGDSLLKMGNGLSAFYISLGSIKSAGDVSGILSSVTDNLKSLIEAFTDDSTGALDPNTIANSAYAITAFSESLNDFLVGISSFNGILPNPIDQMTLRGEELGEALANGIGSKGLLIGQQVDGLLNDIASKFRSVANLEAIQHAVTNYAGTLSTAFRTKLGIAGESAGEHNHSTVFSNIAVNCIEGFKDGLNDARDDLLTMVRELGTEVYTAYSEALGVDSPSVIFMQIGEYCQEGMALGLQNGSANVYKTTTAFSKELLDRVKKFFGINSPSVVMKEEVGEYLVQGIAEGISSDMSAVEAARQMAQNIVSAFQAEIDKFQVDYSTFDLEYQLWEKQNPGASASQRSQAQLDIYNQKGQDLAKTVTLAEAEYQALLQEFGAEDQTTKEAYNRYLQAQLDLYDFSEQYSELRKTVQSNAREMQELFDERVMSYYTANKANGMTYQEAYEKSKLAYGEYFDALFGDSTNGASTFVQGIYDEFMAATKNWGRDASGQIHVDVEMNLQQAMASAKKKSSGGGGGSKSSSSLGSTAANAVENPVEKYVKEAQDAINKVIDEDSTKEGGLMSKAGTFFKNLGDSFDSGLTSITDKIVNIFGSKSTEEKIEDSATGVVSTLADGISDNSGLAEDSAKVVAERTAQVAGSEDTQKLFGDSGLNCVQGFCDGITSDEGLRMVTSAGTTIGDYALQAAMRRLDEHSPSKEFYAIGMWAALGFANGIEDYSAVVAKQVTNMCSAAVDAADYASELLSGGDILTSAQSLSDAEYEALRQKQEMVDYFYDHVFQFDTGGNLVPYGFDNTADLDDFATQSWILVEDDEIARKAREIAESYHNDWDWEEKGFVSPYRQYDGDRKFESDLLQDIYEQSLQNKGFTRAFVEEEEGWTDWRNGTTYKPKEEQEETPSTISFVQNNYSPTALSRGEIYRQTQTQFSQLVNARYPTTQNYKQDYTLKEEKKV